MNIGIIDLLANIAPGWVERADAFIVRRQYVAVTPQAISVWCRQMGHRVHYATFFGFGDAATKLPDDLDIVFVSAHTARAPLAYALSKRYRSKGVRTVIGGPHAKSYPRDAQRFFDTVVLECDRELVTEILKNAFPPGSIVSSLKPYADTPAIEERMPEIRSSVYVAGRPFLLTAIPMLASIGCPYTCDFCIEWNRPYQPFPTERLTADLRYASKNLPGVMLGFGDPNFGIRFDETLACFEEVPVAKRNPYLMETSLGHLRPERLRRLSETHCIAVLPGVESWTQYANKAGTGARGDAHAKMEKVAGQFQALHENVPYLQANFIFGLDDDAGDLPFEVTKEFMRRLPYVWTHMNIPYAFGGTPLFDDFLAQGRILAAMPFTFYVIPYLTIILKHYDPIAFYRLMVSIYEAETSDEMLRSRTNGHSKSTEVAMAHRFRTFFNGPIVNGFRRVLAAMESDPQMVAFHQGDSQRLPDFYAREYRRQLGPYAELMPVSESIPLLSSEPAVPYNLAPLTSIQAKSPAPATN